MPNTRHTDQKVDAFSASRELLLEAQIEALKRGMSKSGFYRYSLAKAIGYSESEALELSEDGSAKRVRETLQQAIPQSAEASIEPHVADNAGETTPVTIRMTRELLEAINRTQRLQGEGRSQFIRNAVRAALEKRGCKLSALAHLAPDRAGKGGSPTHKNRDRDPSS